MLAWGPAPEAGAIELAPHRAIYKMSLAAASRGSGVADASGSMMYSFNDGCEGWDVGNQRQTAPALRRGRAKPGRPGRSPVGRPRTGLSYRFRIRHSRNGAVVENLKGTVTRGKPGEAAEAKFSEPADLVIKLPEGTLFPTRHLIDLIDAGGGGNPVFSRTVFDGASLDNPYEINAIITRDKGADTARGKAAAELISSAGLGRHADATRSDGVLFGEKPEPGAGNSSSVSITARTESRG